MEINISELCYRTVGFNFQNDAEVIDTIVGADDLHLYKVDDSFFGYARFDGCIELWISNYSDPYDAENNSLEIAMGYHSEKPFFVTPESVKGESGRGICCLRIDGTRFPVIARLTSRTMLPKEESNAKYQAEIAFFAIDLTCYDSIIDYDRDFKNKSHKAVCTFSESAEDKAPFIGINGVIRECREKINPITGKSYYCLDVDTVDATLTVLAEACLVDPAIIYKGMIISANCFTAATLTEVGGDPLDVDVTRDTDRAELIKEVSERIVALENLPFEHVSVGFADGEAPDGITFIQTANYGTHYMLEVGIKKDGENRLLRLEEAELHIVLAAFKSLILKRIAPDLSTFADVTELLDDNKDGSSK